MAIWCRLTAGLILVLTLLSPIAAPAIAQDTADEPPEVRTLATGPVELGSGPGCWDVDEWVDPVGGTGDSHTSRLDLIYQAQGRQDVEMAPGGPSRLEAGSAVLIPAEVDYRHSNAGDVAAIAVAFSSSCDVDEPTVANERHGGNTGPLGFRAGPRPTTLTFRTGRSGRGSQGPVVSHPGPVAYYVLEGETAIGLAGGVRWYSQGDVFTVPADTPYQYTNVGGGTNRSLYVILTPDGEPVSQVLSDVSLSQPTQGGRK